MALMQHELKRLLRYDPKTGKWFNRVWRGGSAHAGLETGRPNTDGYIQISVKGKRYMASRLAYFYMTGKWPPFEMDHEDRNKRNGRWNNLRPATDSQNQMNRERQKNNRSGYVGVYKRNGKWGAYIGKNSRRIPLGKFKLKRDAIMARQQAERKLFGEYARI